VFTVNPFFSVYVRSLLSIAAFHQPRSLVVNPRSSAYSMWDTQFTRSPVTAPSMPSLTSLTMSLMYNQREKRRGNRGHPCLTPFVGCTRALFSPSINMYSSFSYICLITLSKVDGIALRRRCDQICCLGTVSSYACKKSMKATCNLGLFLGFSFLAACLRCLRINRRT